MYRDLCLEKGISMGYDFFRTFEKRKTVFMIIFFMVCIFFIAGIFRLKSDNGFTLFTMEKSAINIKYDKMNKALTGNGEVFYLVDTGKKTLSFRDLEEYRKIQETMEHINGVISVSGPAPEKIFIDGRLLPFDSLDDGDFEKISAMYEKYEDLTPLPFMNGRYYAFFNVSVDKSGYRLIMDKIGKFLSSEGKKYFTSGEPYFRKKMEDAVFILTFIIPPISLILIIFFFRINIGGFRATVLSLVPTLVGICWLLGTMGWLGVKLTMATSIIPMVVMVIGSAEGVHFVSHYILEIKTGIDNNAGFSRTISKISVPMLLTSLTTVIGLLSSVNINSSGLRMFSILSALGIVYIIINTWLVLPLILIRIKSVRIDEKIQNTVMINFLRKIDGRKAVILTLGITAVSITGLFFLKTGFSIESLFMPWTDLRINLREFERSGYGGLPAFISVESDGDPFETATGKKILSLEKRLKKEKLIDRSFSPYTSLSIINSVYKNDESYPANKIERDMYISVLNGGTSEKLIVSQQAFVRQSRSNAKNLLSGMVNRKERIARIVIFPSGNGDESMKIIRGVLKEFENPGLRLTLVGLQSSIDEMNNALAGNQFITIGISMGLIFLLMMIFYRNFIFCILTLIPISITLLGMYGIMGLLNINVSIFTCEITGIMVGIGVDYSIYTAVLFLQYKKEGMNTDDAMARSFDLTSGAILANACGFTLGFLPLLFSPLSYQFQFMIVSSFSLCIAALLSLTLLPVIFKKVYGLGSGLDSGLFSQNKVFIKNDSENEL